MSRYRKVEIRVWNDDRFRDLSAKGQFLWLYMLCGPRTTTFPGLVVAREAVMADDLGWTLQSFREAFAEASGKGMARADWKAGIVLLPKALIDSMGDPRDSARPESPNVIRSWAKSWTEVPDSALKTEYLRLLGTFAEALGVGYAQAFREAFAKALAKASHDPSPNQDQDQEQEKEQEQEEPPIPPKGGFDLALVPDLPKPERRRKPKPSEPTEAERASAMRVLGKLGERSGVRYLGSDKHVRLIAARMREGVTELELRYVVGYCAIKLEWQDKPAMAVYLRPETLFGPETIQRYLDPARTWADSLPQSRPQEAS